MELRMRFSLSNFSMHENHQESLLKPDCLAQPPELLIQLVWFGVQTFAFLTSSQMILLLLLDWRPCFEDHCSQQIGYFAKNINSLGVHR